MEVRFTCLPTCWGRCCAKMDLPLFPWDVRNLARGLGISTAAVLRDYTLPGVEDNLWPTVKLLHVRRGACAFLDPGGQCQVYACRPQVCRLYPLAREARPDGTVEYRRADAARCPQGAFAPGCRTRTVAQWLTEELSADGEVAAGAYADLYRRALVDYRWTEWATRAVSRSLAGLLYDLDGVRRQAGTGPAVTDREVHARIVTAADLFLRHLARGAGIWPGPAPDDLGPALQAALRGA